MFAKLYGFDVRSPTDDEALVLGTHDQLSAMPPVGGRRDDRWLQTSGLTNPQGRGEASSRVRWLQERTQHTCSSLCHLVVHFSGLLAAYGCRIPHGHGARCRRLLWYTSQSTMSMTCSILKNIYTVPWPLDQQLNGLATAPLLYASTIDLTVTYIPATQMKAPITIVVMHRVV